MEMFSPGREVNMQNCNYDRIVLLFNRRELPNVVPEVISDYVSGRHHLSTKQVPTSLMLRKTGTPSVKKNAVPLLRDGFRVVDDDGRELSVQQSVAARSMDGLSSHASSLSRLLMEVERDSLPPADLGPEVVGDRESDVSSDAGSDTVVHADEPNVPVQVVGRKTNLHLVYSDPWKIHAGRLYAELKNASELPTTLVWQGDGLRLQDPLPPHLLGDKWTGSKKNRIRFSAISDPAVKMQFLLTRTHWGYLLKSLAYNDDHEDHGWALDLKKRLRAFLEGKPDPSWSKRKRASTYSDPLEKRSLKVRSDRLLELLKTVDGIFLQRYFAYPEEVWNWQRYDYFTLRNISYLLGDEFYDGELTPLALEHVTVYEKLKRLRKQFKEASHTGKLDEFLAEDSNFSEPWQRCLKCVYALASKEEGHRKIFLMGLLSQTRGSGTPPALVVLKSKVKFLTTVSSEQIPLPPTKEALILNSLENILKMLPKEAFTGLATKARVTVTTSASWENSRRDGGTTEAISSIVSHGESGYKVQILDLETGKEIGQKGISELTPGEYIFWASMEEVRRVPLSELANAYLTTVKEPGKARTVTKARACLKIILDLVSKICAVPMKKGIDSSRSGMGKSHHAWNFFLDLMSEESKEDIFHTSNREENEYGGYLEVQETYSTVYASSTDFEEATDKLSHRVGKLLGNGWMLKCGIPRVLRNLVNKTCYEDRKIFFSGAGALSGIGEPAEQYGQGVRFVWLRKGVLMGDPLTKIVLHLVNLVTRDMGNVLRNPENLSHTLTNSEEFVQTFSFAAGLAESRRANLRAR